MEPIHITKNKGTLINTLLLLIPTAIFGIILSVYLVSKSKKESFQLAVESDSTMGSDIYSQENTVLGDQDSIDTRDSEPLH